MKTLYTQGEGKSSAHRLPAVTVQPLHEDEVHQEQMRRLHNARASQRAARHHRIIRAA